MLDLFDRAAKFFHELQTDICSAHADADGAKSFGADAWQRPGGGGGVARVLENGALFEKAGVNWSNVEGVLPAELADMIGASANVVTVGMAERAGYPISFMYYAKVAFIPMLITVIICSFWLLLVEM